MKEKKDNNFIKKASNIAYGFKRNFMTNDTRTVLIVLILIALFLATNLWVRSLNLAQIDVTKEKLYTLTDVSKNSLKEIEKDVLIYVWGFSENTTTVDLLKQYNSLNSKIKYQIITRDLNKDIVEEYSLDDDYPMLILFAGKGTDDERVDYIYGSDMVTVNESYNAVDITEQKITNSILKIESNDIPKIYYLKGEEFDSSGASSMASFEQYLTSFGLYDEEELYTTNAKKFKVPEKCSLLILPTIKKDLNSNVAKQIIKYINGGGKILILSNSNVKLEDGVPNYQSILDLYGIKLPRNFIIESSDFTITKTTSYIRSNISYTHPVTKLLTTLPVLYSPGTIQFASATKLAQLKVSYDPILVSSDKAVARDYKTHETDETGNYIIGTSITKTVSDGVVSKAIVYATQASFSDLTASDLGQPDNSLFMYTSEILMNSVANLTDKGDYYSISKLDTSVVALQTNTTETQDYIIRGIISIIPFTIAIIGVIVIYKRNK